MARIGRFVVPELPHHVTQRGNRREKVSFGDDDYALYRDLLQEACRREGVAVWAYCLMPNHGPSDPDPADAGGSRAGALGKAHRRYLTFVNARMRVTGHLFSGRFADLMVEEPDPAKIAAMRAAETIGRPLGAGALLDRRPDRARPAAGQTGAEEALGARRARKK